jgi:drug/metabolite transporter (DMT)-like permease
MSSTRIKSYLLLITVSLIWGIAAIVIKFTLNAIDPLPFLAYRFLISFAIAVIALSTTRYVLPKGSLQWIEVLVFSFLSTTVALGFLFLGLEYTSVLSLSIITLIIPLLVGVAGVIFLQETITRQEKIGTGIALAGSMLTIIEPILTANNHTGNIIGNIFLLLYLVSEVASVVILKKLLKKNISPIAITHISFIVGFITLTPIVMFMYGGSSLINSVVSVTFPYHAGVLYMALISGTLAYALRAKAQKNIEIGEAALFSYLTSVFSAPLAVIFLGETITLPFIIGALIIAAGVFIAEYRTGKN